MSESVLPRATDEELQDLRERLARHRPVRRGEVGRPAGVDADLLDRLLVHWRDAYDWRVHEERIAALPWVETTAAPVPVRAVVSPAGPDAPVVVLLHGWPDSVLRFERVLPLLEDVTTVVPALPGYPFAAPVAPGGLSAVAMADAVAEAMRELGFERYVVSGGDIGSGVAEALAGRHPEAVSALHLTDLPQHHLADLPDDLDDTERDHVARGRRWRTEEGGYMHEHATKPHTLQVALGDSPAGLAAWIVEKLVSWSDCDGRLEEFLTDDEALTWVTAYWLGGVIGTSFVPYAVPGDRDWPRVQAPTVFTLFPHDLVAAPRQLAERFFDVADFVEHESGGHFASWERPEDYARGVRRALEVRT